MTDIDTVRLRELADRLIAAGPKASHVSASECHEICEGMHAALDEIERLRPVVEAAKTWRADSIRRTAEAAEINARLNRGETVSITTETCYPDDPLGRAVDSLLAVDGAP